MKIKSYNYKFIIGVIIGLLLVTGVSAASYISSNIIYDSDNSSLSTGDVQGAIDDIANRIDNGTKPTECLEGYLCVKYKTSFDDLELGDYISYTPVVSSYSTDTTQTGYSVSQTIYPNELTLWRVLNKNEDGTVEIISEYVSSTSVSFYGQTGFLRGVGYLNVIAKQYETTGITSDSRHFGYNGQIEYLNIVNVQFTDPPPFKNSTTDNSQEDIGGGDILFQKDEDNIIAILGTHDAYKVGTSTNTYYWSASRAYYYGASNYFYWGLRLNNATTGLIERKYSNPLSEDESSYSIRPIVTLKSGLEYYGLGTEDHPIEIITN